MFYDQKLFIIQLFLQHSKKSFIHQKILNKSHNFQIKIRQMRYLFYDLKNYDIVLQYLLTILLLLDLYLQISKTYYHKIYLQIKLILNVLIFDKDILMQIFLICIIIYLYKPKLHNLWNQYKYHNQFYHKHNK